MSKKNTTSRGNGNDSINLNNRALLLALQSAHLRGLLQDKPQLDVARKISIASSKYYLALTGQMDASELKAAVEAVFNYQSDDSITAV